jgi:hypothetical protein
LTSSFLEERITVELAVQQAVCLGGKGKKRKGVGRRYYLKEPGRLQKLCLVRYNIGKHV